MTETLSPHTSLTSAQRKHLKPLIEKIARQVILQRSASHLVEEVYLAGLWHGSQLANKEATND